MLRTFARVIFVSPLVTVGSIGGVAVRAPAPAIGADGSIYVGLDDDNLYAVN